LPAAKRHLDIWLFLIRSATMVFEQLSEGVPTACTTIEEVRPALS